MSQYDIPDPEDLFECPYDNTHMVRAKKIPYHLMKCRRNYTGADYATCPFNARHEMPRPELRFHITHCKDRAMLSQDIVFAQQKVENPEKFKPDYKSDWEPPRSSEDWERDIPLIPRLGVDPNFLKDKNIIRNLTGMTPAQKKVFHQRMLRNFEREQQGLPPLEDDPLESQPEETTGTCGLRLPRDQPLIMRQIQQQKASQPEPKQTPSVFVHSLAMAGIGRGKAPSTVSSISLPEPRVIPGQQKSKGSSQKNRTRIAADIFGHQDNQATFAQHYLSEGTDRPAGVAGLGRGIGPAGRGQILDPQVGAHGAQSQPVPVPVPGRGIGRGAYAFVQQAKPGFVLPKTSASRVEDLRFEVSENESDSGSCSSEDCGDAKKKELRKLNKKLREIEVLLTKKSAGLTLNSEEEAKVQMRAALMKQIADLV